MDHFEYDLWLVGEVRSEKVDKLTIRPLMVPCVDCSPAWSAAAGDKCRVLVDGKWRKGKPPTEPPMDEPFNFRSANRTPDQRRAWAAAGRRRAGRKPLADISSERAARKAEAIGLHEQGWTFDAIALRQRNSPKTIAKYIREAAA